MEITPTTQSDQNSSGASRRSWRGIVTMAGLIVLGLTPWAKGQLATPDLPAYCPPLTAFANPTFFDLFWGTTPIRFPYQ